MGVKEWTLSQSCKADVRVTRKDGKIEFEVKKYKSAVDCLSVDANGNVSESKLKEFRPLNWEGIIHLTTSDDKKYTLRLKQVCDVAPSNHFHYTVEPVNGSDDVEFGLLRNATVQLIAVLAEAPASAEAPLMATYNSVGKTLSFSKGDLIRNWGSMVGNIMTLQFYPVIWSDAEFGRHPPMVWNWMQSKVLAPGYGTLFDWPSFPDFGDKLIITYAKVASVSVEGDKVKVGLTTDGIKTKGKYAEKEVKESLAKVDSGDYTIYFYPPHTFYPSSDNGNNQMFPYVLSVDIDHVDGLANGKTQIQFTPNVARLLTYDAATEMVGSVSSDKYLEESSKEKLKSKMKLYVKTTSGANVFAIESLEKRAIVDAWSARVSGELKANEIKGAWIRVVNTAYK
jgi:hypothetical protein